MPSPNVNTNIDALKKLTVDHTLLLECFLNEVADNEKTHRHYERITALYLVYIQMIDIALEDCKKNTVTGFFRHQYGRLAPSTMRNYMSVLASFYDWLMTEDEDTYERNPALLARHAMKNVIKKSNARKGKKILNLFRGDQFGTILEARRTKINIRPNEERDVERDLAILHVLFGSGLRREEVYDLDCGSFEKKSGSFKLYGKGGKLRTPIILVPSQDVLLHYLNDIRPLFNPSKNEQAMFLTIDQKSMLPRRMTYNRINYMVRKTLKASNLFARGDGGSHVFRRSHGTHLKRSGVPIEDIQDQLSHASINTTNEHYIVQMENESGEKIRDKVGIG